MGQAQPTLKEQMRANERVILRAIRDLDRERIGLERQQTVSLRVCLSEKRPQLNRSCLQTLEGQLRKAAKQNQTAAIRIMAKDYVRTKSNIQRFHEMRTQVRACFLAAACLTCPHCLSRAAQLQGVSLKNQTMSSVEAMSSAMKGAASAMTRMNARMRLPGMQRIARQFAMESERMEMNSEMMSDTVDDAMEGDEDGVEEEALIEQVLGELNVSTMSSLGQLDAPSAAPSAAVSAVAAPAAAAPTAVGMGGGAPAPGADGAAGGGGGGGRGGACQSLSAV
jgi:charged multivesicular body protein 2A